MARSAPARAAGCLFVAVVVVVALVVGGILLLQKGQLISPLPGQQPCLARAGESSVALDLEQARLTSIIVGLSVRRNLAPRAASIAMATAYQETGIRNLDYGDRDSVGLFQQRPSQGWGTEEQLMDPYYATNKFYDALVKIKNWETGDVNDVAQQVQRSGYPEAYRDHEQDARVLASTLTGRSPAGLSCRVDQPGDPDARGMVRSLRRTFGSLPVEREGSVVTIDARNANLAWAYAHYAVANASAFGVREVYAEGRSWQTSGEDRPEWSAATPAAGPDTVRISVG
ncbi:MAG TPA: hypothetical protein VFP89_07545 [Propionibacteriaceae bacterium]|nr:hypothetical protein [Propionibacteriaceae bacterium]